MASGLVRRLNGTPLGRPIRRPRRALRVAGVATAVLSAALLIPTVASASPGDDPGAAGHLTAPIAPRIQSVREQLNSLAERNDQIIEKYNQADVASHRAERAALRANSAYQRAERRLQRSERALAQSAALQYEGGTFSATGALLSSESGASYLDKLDSLSLISQHNAQVVSSFAALQQQAKTAKVTADNLFTQAQQTRLALGRQRAATQKQINRYTSLLHSLTAQQRAMWAARQGAPISAAAARSMTTDEVSVASLRVQAAVRYALAQVGKPYVFGAAGPSTFDCSGLTMQAWHQGGVSLPHSAYQQYNYGHHVSYDQLQPGDLMFFYQPIAHVTIYIGNGMMVSAPEPGENVQVVSTASFANDFSGATRLVG